MSADNWTVCPKCLAEDERKKAAALADAAAQYGKVSADVYESDMAAARQMQIKELESTFREDYELGIHNDGSFFVSYHGGCRNCDANFEYKYEVQAIDTSETPKKGRKR